jgi:hypothetical protein|tara:strand:- start:942 stop:1265 length:324 start_codon:yes stop_codon:yes gene_type:complete
MTPEQKKMLDNWGFYPEATASVGGADGYYGGGGRAGMVAELMENLNLGAGVSGYGYKTPSSGVKLVPTNYDASLDYATDGYGDFGIGGNFDPNSKDYGVSAKWKKRF